MRRRTLVLVTPPSVIAVLAAGYVGYGAWSRSKPVHYARGGAFAAADPPSTVQLVTPSSAPSASGRPTPAPTATARATAAATSAPPAPAPVPAQAAPQASPRAARAVVRRLPAVGTYRVAVQGSEQVRFGPVSFCSREFPSDSAWSVHRAEGERPTSYALDQRYFPGQEGQHDERHIYDYDGTTVTLAFEQATVTCAGQRQSSDVTFSPAQLRIRGPLHVGDSWTSSGGDADRTEDATTKVLRTEQRTVDGRSLTTYVVETTARISGSESGSRTQRWWWAPALALPVQVFEEISAQRSGGQYSSSATTTVTDLPPGA